jgi:hypothetical protein
MTSEQHCSYTFFFIFFIFLNTKHSIFFTFYINSLRYKIFSLLYINSFYFISHHHFLLILKLTIPLLCSVHIFVKQTQHNPIWRLYNSRAILRRSKISGIHPEILLHLSFTLPSQCNAYFPPTFNYCPASLSLSLAHGVCLPPTKEVDRLLHHSLSYSVKVRFSSLSFLLDFVSEHMRPRE